jgi:hypothetical protein
LAKEMRESPAGLSMFGQYQSCPRRWAFKYALGFVPDHEGRSEYLVHGSAVHEGKRVFYVSWDIEKAIETAIDFADESYDVFPSISIEKQRLEKLFRVWYEKYGKDEKENYTVISNETQEEIELPNGAVLTIRIDQVLRSKEEGNFYIFDTKTTKGSIEKTITEYEYKGQPLLYIASIYKSNPMWLTDFRGWITDVMYQRVNFKRNGALSSISTDCKRSPPIMYTEDQCQSYLESLTTLTSEVAWAYTSFKKGAPFNACFPMNRNSCRSYNSTCPYWSICFRSFTMGSKPESPFKEDDWHKDGVIDELIEKIHV